jgi:hypothetical protein
MTEGIPVHKEERFPFKEELQDGGFFQTIQELKDLGYTDDQIWSVCEAQDEDGSFWYVTGPCYHRCDLMGYTATKERHDGLTYYYEKLDDGE